MGFSFQPLGQSYQLRHCYPLEGRSTENRQNHLTSRYAQLEYGTPRLSQLVWLTQPSPANPPSDNRMPIRRCLGEAQTVANKETAWFDLCVPLQLLCLSLAAVHDHRHKRDQHLQIRPLISVLCCKLIQLPLNGQPSNQSIQSGT
jgi:hypothetical protein